MLSALPPPRSHFHPTPATVRLKMIGHPCILVALILALSLVDSSLALQQRRALPFGDKAMDKRNLGGELKDLYLSHFTHNYFCTDTGRLVPVDPATGQMLQKNLRKRNFIDNALGHTHATEKGLCRNRK